MENDAIRLNLFSILAYESTLTLDTEQVSLIDAMNYEDQTQFALLSGTGRYWIQTSNLQHLVFRLSPVVFEPEPAEEPISLPTVQEEPKPEKAPVVQEEESSPPPSKKASEDEEPDLDIDKIVEEL
jgi:hypothetical protein